MTKDIVEWKRIKGKNLGFHKAQYNKMEEDINLHQQLEENRSKPSSLLKKLGIASACIVPLMAYATLRGYFDSKGIPIVDNQTLRKAISYTALIPAVGAIGQLIPFRFDNFDPGVWSTLVAIPLGLALNNACYSWGHSLGSVN